MITLINWLKGSIVGIIILGAIGSIIGAALIPLLKTILTKIIVPFSKKQLFYIFFKPFLIKSFGLKMALKNDLAKDRDIIIYFIQNKLSYEFSKLLFIIFAVATVFAKLLCSQFIWPYYLFLCLTSLNLGFLISKYFENLGIYDALLNNKLMKFLKTADKKITFDVINKNDPNLVKQNISEIETEIDNIK